MDAPVSQVDLLSRLLDASQMRQRLIAQNVANVNTPGYRQLNLSFDEAFARALGAGRDGEALKVKPNVVQGGGGAERADGNNVDIDAEMARLNKNSVLYEVYTQLLATQLASMRSAISGH